MTAILSLLEACQARHPDPRDPKGTRSIPLVVLLTIHLEETHLELDIRRSFVFDQVSHLIDLLRMPAELVTYKLNPERRQVLDAFLTRNCGFHSPIEPSGGLSAFVHEQKRPPRMNSQKERDKRDAEILIAAIAQLQRGGKTY
jgi:hypothetical protein